MLSQKEATHAEPSRNGAAGSSPPHEGRFLGTHAGWAQRTIFVSVFQEAGILLVHG